MRENNILLVFEHEEKFRVYDVEVTEIKKHTDWKRPRVASVIERLRVHVSEKYTERFTGDGMIDVYNFVTRYHENNGEGQGVSLVMPG